MGITTSFDPVIGANPTTRSWLAILNRAPATRTSTRTEDSKRERLRACRPSRVLRGHENGGVLFQTESHLARFARAFCSWGLIPPAGNQTKKISRTRTSTTIASNVRPGGHGDRAIYIPCLARSAMARRCLSSAANCMQTHTQYARAAVRRAEYTEFAEQGAHIERLSAPFFQGAGGKNFIFEN